MARGIYHGPFWHKLGLSSKGECPSCQLKHPPACRKSRSQHCHCTERTKEPGGWDQKGLNGASQRCAQPCQELSHILVRQAQSRFRKKIWVRDHGRWVKTVQQCRGTWMKSHQGGLVLVLGWQNGENSLLLVLLLLLHLHHRDISWPHKEGTWLGLGKISSHIGTKPEKSTVFQQITYEKGSEGNT